MKDPDENNSPEILLLNSYIFIYMNKASVDIWCSLNDTISDSWVLCDVNWKKKKHVAICGSLCCPIVITALSLMHSITKQRVDVISQIWTNAVAPIVWKYTSALYDMVTIIVCGKWSVIHQNIPPYITYF